MACNLATPYSCNNSILQLPVPGETQSPFIILTFGNDPSNSLQLTVGNMSSPAWNNTAIIKSLELGIQGTCNGTIEIIDEMGGTFQAFVDRVFKHMPKASSSNYQINIVFGWVICHCDGSKTLLSSPTINLTMMSLEVEFTSGIIKYSCGISALPHISFVQREDQNIGTSTQTVELKQGVSKLLSQNEPKLNSQFLRRNQDGTFSTYNFQGNPQASWSPDKEHKIGAAMKWMNSFLTDGQKGVVPISMITNDYSPNTVIFLEDIRPGPNQTDANCSNDFGTFIVNGGNCSNVLSFTPKLDWPAAMAILNTGGGSAGAADGKPIVKTKPDNIQTPQTGLAAGAAITGPGLTVYGPIEVGQRSSLASDAYDGAGQVMLGAPGEITAELKIQGNPDGRFIDFSKLIGLNISIVVVNPYNIQQVYSNQGCGDWLARPAFNSVLSSNKWRITGAHHSIKEGSFVTTLQVVLRGPDISLPPNAPFDGNGYYPQW